MQLISGLSRSASNVSTVAALVKRSYTDMPASKKAVGEDSRALVEAREQMTKKLVVYRELHLPLSNAVVNDLIRTLEYFRKDYSEFKSLLRFVQKQVNEAEDRAKFVHDMYVTLGAELQKLGEDASKALKVAVIKAKDNAEAAKAIAKYAKAFAIGASGTAAGGLTVGAGLALGLLGPGGWLFAPALAIPALVGSTTLGVAGATVPGATAAVLHVRSSQKQRVADALTESNEVYKTVFEDALQQFSDCVKHFINYFHGISSKLANVDANMNDLGNSFEDAAGDFSEDELRALYNVIRGQADELRKACNLYVANISQTKIDIELLKIFEDEKYTSYIDEWYKQCPSEKKTMKSTKNLLKQALPERTALHQ